MSGVEYGVMAGVFKSAIYVGRLNKTRTEFTNKQDGTDMVLVAVGDYVQGHFDGGLVAEYPGRGIRIEIKVTPLPPA